MRRPVFSPDGQTLASGSDDQTIRLWDVRTGKELATLTGHKGPISSVVFSPDGRTLASAARDKTIRLWDVRTGKALAILSDKDPTSMVVFSPDGRTLAFVFSPDGRTLASASLGKTIRLWDAQTGKALSIIKGHDNVINTVVFSPDGRTLASASRDNTIGLWDVRTGKALATLRVYEDWVYDIVFSPGGRTLASASDSKNIRLWDLSLLYDQRPWEEKVSEAERRYGLQLVGLELQPLDPETHPYFKEPRPPAWPRRHPWHWLPAAEQGDAPAMLELGIIYERDDDPAQARQWYEKAAAAGQAEAREHLDILNRRLPPEPK